MIQFFIQTDSEISPSTQLFDQLSFAITTCAYANGEQLPSTRQLAQWTGLHRNTINKVYQQLKKAGLAEAKGGSGIYAATPKQESQSLDLSVQVVRQTIDRLLNLGYSLPVIREIFNAELNWRLNCSAELLVISGKEDPGVGQIMASELEQALNIPIQTIAIEDLSDTLDRLIQANNALTVVTNRYFAEVVHRVVGDRPIRIFTVDIYNYSQEINRIKQLPLGSSVGLVSVSTGILRFAESLIQSIRQDILIISTLPQDTYRLRSAIKTVDLLIIGHSAELVTNLLNAAIDSGDRIRPLEVMYSVNYIALDSIRLLKLELGIEG
jgi:GntR family transcriptional regulator